MRFEPNLGAHGFFDLFQFSELGFLSVEFIQRITPADEPVSWRCRAVAESPAYPLFFQRAPSRGIAQEFGVGENRAPNSDAIGPTQPQDGRRHCWEKFLQVSVARADEEKTFGRLGFELFYSVDLTGYINEGHRRDGIRHLAGTPQDVEGADCSRENQRWY